MKLPSYMRLSCQNQSMQGQANICTSFGNIIAKTNTISKRKRQREREFELLCLRKFCMWKLYGSPQCVCVMRAKLIFTNWLHALVCLIKCLRIQFKFSVLFSFFFLLFFFFFEIFSAVYFSTHSPHSYHNVCLVAHSKLRVNVFFVASSFD